MRRFPAVAVVFSLLLACSALGALIGHAPPNASARIAADGTCEVRVRVDGVEGWQAMPPEFCAFPTATPTATSAPPTATATAAPTATSTPPPPTATATATATATPTPAPQAGRCGEDFWHWHAPTIGGCATGHEHGDAPPAWVVASRWMPMFEHPGNTPSENALKHTSFKGFVLRDDGVDLYVIVHLDTNPNGHTSRFHSYQAWARDASGAVSYWDLWADFGVGNNTEGQVRPGDNCPGGSGGVRPIITVNYQSCPGLSFETWYSRAGAAAWGWDFGFSISPNYYGGPSPGVRTNGDLANSANWLPTGQLNTNRRMEAAWYADRSNQRGDFWATQFGEVVSGPGDARCGQPRTFGARTYTTLCLAQYIAPSLGSVQFPGNAIQRQQPGTGVENPN